jgi:hypothetical protein
MESKNYKSALVERHWTSAHFFLLKSHHSSAYFIFLQKLLLSPINDTLVEHPYPPSPKSEMLLKKSQSLEHSRVLDERFLTGKVYANILKSETLLVLNIVFSPSFFPPSLLSFLSLSHSGSIEV